MEGDLTQFFSGAEPARASDTSRPTVIFVGSFVSFPDQLLRLFENEFPDFVAVRVPGPDDLPAAQAGGQAHLVVLQEGFLEAALGWGGNTPVALAYRQIGPLAERLGAHGLEDVPDGLSFLPMSARLDAWLSIMRLLLCLEKFVPVDLLRALQRAGAGDRGQVRVARALAMPDPALAGLTRRECQVLPLVAEGKPNKIIAKELEMSEHTVKLHVHHIIHKLGVQNRTEAARFYFARTRDDA